MKDDRLVQDLLKEDLFDEGGNETVEVLSFIKNNDVAIGEEQLRAILVLNQLGLNDVANFIINSRQLLTTGDKFRKTIEKLTLADRIKGNAKLSSILKPAMPAVVKQEDVK